MISTAMTKAIHLLPDQLVSFLSKKIVNWYLKKYAQIHVQGMENLKGIKTPTIFICNHLSNADGLILNEVLKEINPTFVAGIKLSNNALTDLGIRVVKTTTIDPKAMDKEGLKKIIQLVKQGESICIFPEGTRSRVGQLIEAKKGVLLITKMTGAPITPIGLYGTEKLLPINKEEDMSAETFNKAEVFVQIGKPFMLPDRTKEQVKNEYDDFAIYYIMKEIANLLPENYRGVYK